MVLMLYVKMKVTDKDIISEYRVHVYADHLSFEVSGLFISEEGNQWVWILGDGVSGSFLFIMWGQRLWAK